MKQVGYYKKNVFDISTNWLIDTYLANKICFQGFANNILYFLIAVHVLVVLIVALLVLAFAILVLLLK